MVVVPADCRPFGDYVFHVSGHKYIDAVVKTVGATVLTAPALGEASDIDALLDLADGILLTGAVSNVHPSHFGQAVRNPALPLDPHRDGLTLKLIRAAVDRGVPLLGICRGLQEINVAFGGSLYQAVHEERGMNDHRERSQLPVDERYAPVHAVQTVPGGNLERITGQSGFMVNSLHGQGIDRLGNGLVAEAHAPDGLIEAIGISTASDFALAVQWHPEWNVLDTPVYRAIFAAFADACWKKAQQRSEHRKSQQNTGETR